MGPLSDFSDEVILDGEIVAWRHNHNEDGGTGAPGAPDVGAMGWGHAMPFGEIQKRLGRKQVSQKLISEVPIAYVVFDVIYAGGELTLDKPLSERSQILDRVFAGAEHVAPRPIINSQGNLMFEPRSPSKPCRDGYCALRRCVATRLSSLRAISKRRWRGAMKA